MLAAANLIPDLPLIANKTEVILDISLQSLQVVLLIHEYMKLLSGSAGNSLLYFTLLSFKSNDSFPQTGLSF